MLIMDSTFSFEGGGVKNQFKKLRHIRPAFTNQCFLRHAFWPFVIQSFFNSFSGIKVTASYIYTDISALKLQIFSQNTACIFYSYL